jgi:hypothetical protein
LWYDSDFTPNVVTCYILVYDNALRETLVAAQGGIIHFLSFIILHQHLQHKLFFFEAIKTHLHSSSSSIISSDFTYTIFFSFLFSPATDNKPKNSTIKILQQQIQNLVTYLGVREIEIWFCSVNLCSMICDCVIFVYFGN